MLSGSELVEFVLPVNIIGIYSVLSTILWYLWYVVILKSHEIILVNFRLRRMKAEFLNMPELAQCCSLADIVPPFQV